ncbi:MAG: HpcH/HpaI aldolase family protein [Hyphomicrobiales bacterium]
MKPKQTLRERLTAGEPLIFSWSSMPTSLSTEVFADGPFEACCVDMQHGYAGYSEFLAMTAPVFAAGKPLMVRIPLDRWDFAARALDAGASAVISPMINTVEDARKFVEATKFPPIGSRSFGAYRNKAGANPADKGFLAKLNDANLTLAMIETQQALDNLDAICATDGLDGVFVGPFDLSISLTHGEGPINPASDMIIENLKVVADTARKHKMFAGIFAANPEFAKKYIELGYQFLALSNDMTYLEHASKAAFAQLAD